MSNDNICHPLLSSVFDELAYHLRGCVLFSYGSDRPNKIGRMVEVITRHPRNLLRDTYNATREAIRMDIFRASRFAFSIKGSPVSDPSPLRFFVPFFFCDPRGKWYSRAPFQIDMERYVVSAKVFISGKTPWGPAPIAQVFYSYTEINGGRYTIRLSHDNKPDDKVSDMKKRGYSKQP